MSAEIPDGAVIVARAIVNSSLWKMRPEDRVVAVTCLAIANKRQRKWFDGHQQITIQRGQFVRSRQEMAQECGLPVQVVRTSIVHLEENDFLTRNLTRTYTLYTIPKYQHYQDLTKYSDYGVKKLTQDPTRLQPSKAGKYNQAASCDGERNPIEPQIDASLLTHCGNFLTNVNGKTNHKQQQQIPPSSLVSNSSEKTDGDGRGFAVVVGPGTWTDPILSKPSFRVAATLLEGIRMAKSIAHSFAATKPLGLVLRVVRQARLQKRPGGWARTALENDWWLPEASGDELQEVIDLVKRDADHANTLLLPKSGPQADKLPRLPEESEREWLKRNMDHLHSKKGKAK